MAIATRFSPEAAFTIIEVLIVLAVVGLIMLIVFLAVPAVQRNARDTERKHLVAEASTDFQEYVNDNQGKYPDTPAEYCSFINGYMRRYDPSLGACNPVLVSPDECVLVSGNTISICYHDRGSAHNYMGPYDQINIQQGHWCGTDPSNTGEYPLTDGGSPHSWTFKYAVWTPLEGGGVVCTGASAGL